MSKRDSLLIAIVAALVYGVIALSVQNWHALMASICWAHAAFGWRSAIAGDQP